MFEEFHKKKVHHIHLSFGPGFPTIDEQLSDQGFKLDLVPLERAYLQRDVDEVNRLFIRGVLTEAESDKAHKRIFRIIKKQLKPL